MSKIAIISSGYFPVPAVKGGAVETLIEKLIISNEQLHLNDFTVYSTANAEACNKANYKFTKIKYIKDNIVLDFLDKVIYHIAKIVIRGDKQMSFRYIMHRIGYIVNVAKNLKKYNYDYVVIENTATLFWCLKLFGNTNKYRDKVIYHVHNVVGSSFGCSKLIQNSKYILGVSEYINSTLKERFPHIQDSKLRVLYNTVDVTRISESARKSDSIRKKFKIKDNEILFLFVGRLCKDKGIEELLEAFIGIDIPNIKLMVVGNYYFGTDLVSNFEKHLYEMILSQKERIIFTGFVANSDIGSYYGAADVVVLPSIWEEPAGLTIIESMAAGATTVSTNVGGIPEYVGEGNAILVDKNEPDFVCKLRNVMINLVKNDDLRKAFSNKAHHRAEKFDYVHYAEMFNDSIREIRNENKEGKKN